MACRAIVASQSPTISILRGPCAQHSVWSWAHGCFDPWHPEAMDALTLETTGFYGTGMTHERLGVVVGVGNHKGGVSKSSLATYLASALGERNLQTLIVDCDPSGGATHIFGIEGKSFAGTFELVVREAPDPMSIAVADGLPRNVSIIPGRTELAELKQYVSKFADLRSLLKRGLDAARRHYDVIILDTPPNAQDNLTVSAYLNADWFLLAAFADMLSIHGLNEGLADIADARRNGNPNLEVLGIVVNAVDARTKTWHEVNQLVHMNFPGRAFSTVVSRAQAVSDATKVGKTLFQIPKFRRHTVVSQYRQIAAEIHARITNREAFLQGGADAIPKLEPLGANAARPETDAADEGAMAVNG